MRKLLRNRIQLLNRSLTRAWFVLFFAIASPAFSATFTASLDRTSIVIGEQVVLTLKFEGGQPEEISNPRLDGLQIVSQDRQTSRIVFTAWRKASTVYTYSFHAGTDARR